jgi:hypothetical protein
MKDDTKTFCDAVRQRSQENRNAMNRIGPGRATLSPAMSILRQELDSMVRVIWLLSVQDKEERERLIQSTLTGQKWTVTTGNGKPRKITDREMVELAQRLQGWTLSVYKFGCAFIHLSDFHNHAVQDPFRRLPEAERQDILGHMRNYHCGPLGDDPDMEELAHFLPQVFEKIAGNLDCYLKSLEEGKTTE